MSARSHASHPHQTSSNLVHLNADQSLPDATGERETLYRMEVTPEVANRWLTRYAYPRQRNRREGFVFQLAEAIRGDRFEAATPIQFATIKDDPRRYLIDGQHRLAAVAYSGIPTTLWIRDVVLDTEEELHMTYARLDRGMMRSAPDILRSLGNEGDLTPSTYRYLAQAMGFIMTGFHAFVSKTNDPVQIAARDTEIRARLISQPEWHEAAVNLVDAASVSPRGGEIRRLRVTPILAVALVTMRYQPEAATIFWGTVASTNGLVEDDPAHTLARWLVLRERGRRPEHIARTGASAWNAAFEGRTLKGFSIKPDQIAKPILIAGTPYDGKSVVTTLPDESASAVH